MSAAEIVRLKLLRMADELKYLEYVWEHLQEFEKDYFRNNYTGELPDKYK